MLDSIEYTQNKKYYDMLDSIEYTQNKKYYDILDSIEYTQNKNLNLAKIIEYFQLKYNLIAQNQQTPRNNSTNLRKNNFTLI